MTILSEGVSQRQIWTEYNKSHKEHTNKNQGHLIRDECTQNGGDNREGSH